MLVYCACMQNPSCVHCNGLGMLWISHQTDANTTQYFIPRTGKIGVSPLEKFMEMDSSILSKWIRIWVADKVLPDTKLKILTDVCGESHIPVSNKFKNVFFALELTFKEIISLLNLAYSFGHLINKKLTIKIEIPNNTEPYYIGLFKYEDEKVEHEFFNKFIQFFKKQFMPDIFDSL